MDDGGKALEPLFGPSLTGLSNLGNRWILSSSPLSLVDAECPSCYMSSVLQTLFSLLVFQHRYNTLSQNHADACTSPLPAECTECQMHKIADGLLSGRYSHPANYSSASADALQHPSPTPVFQAGIRPTGFKTLIGKGHEEFSTMRQQDSEEFFTYLLTILRRDLHKHKDHSQQGILVLLNVAAEWFCLYLLRTRCDFGLLIRNGTKTRVYQLQKGKI